MRTIVQRPRVLIILFVLAALTAEFSSVVAQGTKAGRVHRVVHNWPILPEGRILGQATGVDVDSHNHVFVFHRAGREWSNPFPTEPISQPTVMMFEAKTGRLVASWGEGIFIMPHSLSVDAENNVWVTDVGLHQVLKFTHDGELVMRLGEAAVPGDDAGHFNRPTDVAVLSDGSFYVSDGYINARVLKFSPSGQLLMQWGRQGSAPGEFDLPHSVAVDSKKRVYVADRDNARVQVFDGAGNYLSEWKSADLGRPYAIVIDAGENAFVADGGDQPASPPDRSHVARLDLAGRIQEVFGKFGNYDGQFYLAHDIAVGPDGAIYVVDVRGRRVQKFAATNEN